MIRNWFPGFRTARRMFHARRMPHFRFFGSWFAAEPKALEDKPEEEVRRINEAAQRYYEDPSRRGYWLNTPFSDPFAHWILYRFGFLLSAVRPLPCHRILDFGCGPGWASVMLAQMGCEVVGMDIARGAVDLGNQRADQVLNPAQRERCAFRAFSGFEIPFPDGHFDVVLVQEAIHHFPNPKTLFREWARVLGSHGKLAFAEPGLEHSEADISLQERDKGILEQDIELEQLNRTGREAGFRDVELLVPPVHPDHHTLPMNRARWFLRGLSWFVPADFLRHAMVTGPMGLFARSPYANPSIFPRSHRAELQSAATARQVRSSENFDVSISVRNISETVWLREGHHGIGFVRPAASLLDAENRLLVRDFGRSDLPRDVLPGESAGSTLKLIAPADPGTYIVRLDLVNEGVTWFGEAGSRTMDVRLEVC